VTLVHYVSDDISQLVPVIHAYRDRFATHVLACDAMTLPQAEQLRRGMERFAAGYQLRWQVTIRTIDAADPSAAVATLLPELGQLDRVWFHASDAPAMMTLLLGRAIQEQGGAVISHDLASDRLFRCDPSGHRVSASPLPERLRLEPFLTLMGYRIASHATREDLLPRRKQIARLYHHPSRFKKLRRALLNPGRYRDFPYDFKIYMTLSHRNNPITII